MHSPQIFHQNNCDSLGWCLTHYKQIELRSQIETFFLSKHKSQIFGKKIKNKKINKQEHEKLFFCSLDNKSEKHILDKLFSTAAAVPVLEQNMNFR